MWVVILLMNSANFISKLANNTQEACTPLQPQSVPII